MKKNKKNILGSVFVALGILLITAAVCLVGYNIYHDRHAASVSASTLEKLSELIADKGTYQNGESSNTTEDISQLDTETPPDYKLNPQMEMPHVTVDGIDYIGILNIPSLGLQLPVTREWSYANLNVAPSRYAGSAYTDDMVIAAHNYAAHFASLWRLEEGSEVIFTDVDGNVFTYVAVLTETLSPNEVSAMTDSGFALSLFTCNNAGNARITVRCNSVAE